MLFSPKRDHFHFHIGMRNLKTAIAATLCAMIYYPFKRSPAFACIGAIFGLGGDVETSWHGGGGNRLMGTVIGGFLGMGLFRLYICFYPDGSPHGLMFPFVFVGVVLLILISQSFGWPDAVQPGGVVLCIVLFNTPVDTYISYSLNRMFNTAVGVIVALAVNYFFPREKVVKWLEALRLRIYSKPAQ